MEQCSEKQRESEKDSIHSSFQFGTTYNVGIYILQGTVALCVLASCCSQVCVRLSGETAAASPFWLRKKCATNPWLCHCLLPASCIRFLGMLALRQIGQTSLYVFSSFVPRCVLLLQLKSYFCLRTQQQNSGKYCY